MIAAEENQPDEAVRNFRKSLSLRPEYTTALLNLGNIYRRQGNLSDARQLLSRALELEPENPEANYSLGMLYARQNDPGTPSKTTAECNPHSSRPMPKPWNNLGVLLVRQVATPTQREIQSVHSSGAPNFDQAYLKSRAALHAFSTKGKSARSSAIFAALAAAAQNRAADLEMLNELSGSHKSLRSEANRTI